MPPLSWATWSGWGGTPGTGQLSQSQRDLPDDRVGSIGALLDASSSSELPGALCGLVDNDPPVDHEDDAAWRVFVQCHEENGDVNDGGLACRGWKVEEVRPPAS